MVTVATWNVNSVKTRLPHLLGYLRSGEAPDILLLQELKCVDDAFPFLEVEDAGYNIAVHGQKTYNGVGILSRFPVEDVVRGLPGDESDTAARYIEALVNVAGAVMRVASVYVPNGQSPESEKFSYKLGFLDRLAAHTSQLLSYDEMLVIGGDYNIAPDLAMDSYAPKHLDGAICCHPEERKKFRQLLHLGLTDVFRRCHPESHAFSWWDYRAGAWEHDKGLRIDHLLLSPYAADQVLEAGIVAPMRGAEKPSDHVPVWCRFGLAST